MDIYKHTDYKIFIKDTIKSLPQKGRGQLTKLAKYVHVHPVVMSQVLNGDRQFTTDQAYSVAEYFQLNDNEADFLFLLVEKERVASFKVKQRIERKLNQLREDNKQVKEQLQETAEFNEEAKATFYSRWQYAAISLLSEIEGYNTVESIAEYFQMDRTVVQGIISFLVDYGICREENGKILPGLTNTHVSFESPLVARHHGNWRLKAIESQDRQKEEELFVTAPLSVSIEDAALIREELLKTVKKISQISSNSKPEVLMALSMDWFGY